MVQILPANERPSFSQRLSRGIGVGLEQAQQLMQQYQQEKQMAAEKQQRTNFLNQLTGQDTSGLSDQQQNILLSEALKGQKQRELEEFKQQGKEKLFGKKQEYLSQIFGPKESITPQEVQEESVSNQTMVDPSRISDADIAQAASIDPVLGRELRAAKDTALKERRSEREFQERQRLTSPEYQREQKLLAAQSTADVKYNQELQAAHKQHEIKTHTLNRLEELNKKGITGKPYEKLLEKFGLVNLTSEGRREFAADVKNLITDIRSILGGQFSQFEFQTILNAYPSADFSQKANDAIIKNLKDFQDIRNQEFKIAKEIKKENGGKVPVDFQSMVNERLEQYAQSKLPEIKANSQKIMNEEYGITEGNILMFDPQGEPLNVPSQDVERYQSLGAVLP